jgi:hypothetical protein
MSRVRSVLLFAAIALAACGTSDRREDPTGRECEVAADCPAGEPCIPVDTDRRACTKACRVDADCVVGWTCGSFGGVSGLVCLCTAAATEICDSDDDDCDGTIDERCTTRAD